MNKFKLIALLAISTILLAACQPVSIEEAQAQLCADLDEFQVAMEGVHGLTADSTVEQADEALEVANDAFRDVANSAALLREAKIDNLDEAYEDLDDAIRDIDEGGSLDAARESLQTELDNVDAAYDEFYNVQCGE